MHVYRSRLLRHHCGRQPQFEEAFFAAFTVAAAVAVGCSHVAAAPAQDTSSGQQPPAEVDRGGSYCPSSRPFVNCTAADPCVYARPCAAHPQAVCRPDYCGGCVAKFYVEGREVHCENEVGVICELSYAGFGCPDGKTIRVRSANYGRRNRLTCRHPYDADWMHNATACLQPKATDIIRSLCDGVPECFPDVSNAVFGDPCYSVYKYLEVDFECADVLDDLGGGRALQAATSSAEGRLTIKRSDRRLWIFFGGTTLVAAIVHAAVV